MKLNSAVKIMNREHQSEILWEHRLRSPGLVRWTILVIILEVLQCVLCIPLIIDAGEYVRQNHINDALKTSGLVLFLIMFSTFSYFSYVKYLIRLVTTRYLITPTHLHFEHGFFKKHKESFAIADVVEIQKMEYLDDDRVTLLFITDHKTKIQGFDFEKHTLRDWPSFEILREPDVVIGIINKFKGTEISLTQKKKKETKYFHEAKSNQVLALIASYLGAFYLFLGTSFLIYAIDTKVLPQKIITDRVIGTTIILSGEGDEIAAVHFTEHDYCFGTYRRITAKGLLFELKLSPLFNSVTDASHNGKSYKHQFTTGLRGIGAYFYLFTYGAFLTCGFFIVTRRGYFNAENLIMVCCAPIFLLLISTFIWNVYNG